MPPARDLSPSTLLARLIDSVRINATQAAACNGRTVLIKRRLAGRSAIIALGNLFLHLSHSRIVMFPRTKDWQTWEQHSFDLLYGPQYHSGIIGHDSIYTEQLPGLSLKTQLECGTLTAPMMESAGREFRRVHGLFSPLIGDRWSHGDPHLANVLFDADTARAYLIDFETRHVPGLSADERHADDLLVFMLDLLGRAPRSAWPDWSRVFLAAYAVLATPAVRPSLLERLTAPRCLESVLWKSRTAFLSTARLHECLAQLREIIETEWG